MRNYTVYFELFGKKMKTTLIAKNEEEAKEIIKNKIKFYKVEKKSDDNFNDFVDIMEDFLRGFGKKG